jgi:hypothetical protein
MFIVLLEPMYLYQYVKGIMLLSLLIVLIVFFALRVNIQYMSIKQAFSLFFVCSLSSSIIIYACPNFQTTCAMAFMFTLQQFELSTLPSIPFNGHVGGLC